MVFSSAKIVFSIQELSKREEFLFWIAIQALKIIPPDKVNYKKP
jgi:hypothetical protein